jgi:hypothetical protein
MGGDDGVHLEQVDGRGKPAFDVVCKVCRGRFSLMDDESIVLQVQAFVARHRHRHRDRDAREGP